MCSVLYEQRILQDILLGDMFIVWGWAPSASHAKVVALFHIVDKANRPGVVAHSLDAQLGRAVMRSEACILKWLHTTIPKAGGQAATNSRWESAPPSFFNMLKWKSKECHTERPLLEWRDVISFLRHPFRGWGRLGGRALQLIVTEVANRVFSSASHNMLGVWDQVMAATRLVGKQGNVYCFGHNMEDMYWEVPKDGMVQALPWALLRLLAIGKTQLFFALAKGGLNELQRIGPASSEHYVMVNRDRVETYVKFELSENCFFTMGPIGML